MTTVAILHTVPSSIAVLNKKIKDLYPNVNIINILDDSILPLLQKAPQSKDKIYEKLLTYVNYSVDAGASVIFIACATICPFADFAKGKVQVKIVRVDEAIASFIANNKKHALIMGTLNSALEALPNLIKSKNNEVTVSTLALAKAQEAVVLGNLKLRDELLNEAIAKADPSVDCIVFTQVSLSHMVNMPNLYKKDMVFSCDDFAIANLKDYLNK